MTYLYLAIGFVAFFALIYVVVMLSGTFFTKRQIEDDPELRENVSDDDMQGLPTDVEY